MMADGFSMLAEGKSPRFIQDKLNAYLDEEVRFDIGSQQMMDDFEEEPVQDDENGSRRTPTWSRS